MLSMNYKVSDSSGVALATFTDLEKAEDVAQALANASGSWFTIESFVVCTSAPRELMRGEKLYAFDATYVVNEGVDVTSLRAVDWHALCHIGVEWHAAHTEFFGHVFAKSENEARAKAQAMVRAEMCAMHAESMYDNDLADDIRASVVGRANVRRSNEIRSLTFHGVCHPVYPTGHDEDWGELWEGSDLEKIAEDIARIAEGMARPFEPTS